MSDEHEGAAPPTAAGHPEASPNASAGAAPANGAGEPGTVDPGALEAQYKRKMAASFRRGGEEREAKRLEALGAGSWDEVQQVLDAHRAAQEEAEHAEGQAADADQRSALRNTRAELRAAQRALEESDTRMARLRAQNERARATELHNRLMGAGAHPEAVSDLVSLLLPQVDWSDDGEGLEVVERNGTGKSTPTGMTLDELIAEQREKRRYFFAQPGAGGSGSRLTASATPPGRAAPEQRSTWRSRLQKARESR